MNNALDSLERLEVGEVDDSGTEALCLLNLVPVEDLQYELGADT